MPEVNEEQRNSGSSRRAAVVVGVVMALVVVLGGAGLSFARGGNGGTDSSAVSDAGSSIQSTGSPSDGPGAQEPVEGPAVFDPAFQHGLVPTSGGKLHYVMGGDGPALVLVHGWPETWWDWRLVMPALAQDHTVIAFDLPGLGDSEIPQDGYDQATTAARLHEAVNALGFDEIQVMGHDMGVLIGYAWARDFPKEVKRLAVLDSMLLGYGLEKAYSLSFHFRLNMAPSPIPETLVDDDDVATYLDYVFQFAAVPDAIDTGYFIKAYSDPARRSAGYNYYRAWPDNAEDTKAHASQRLTQPVLAMGAEAVFGAGVGASFENVADDVRTVVAPGAGHWIQEETPQFLVDCAEYFFGPAGETPASPELANCAA